MKYLIQFLIIIGFTFAGEVLHYFIPLPIPAGIYGIVLLFLALVFRIVKVKDIYETSLFLIVIMPVMFIPAAVGLIESWNMIRSSWVQYLILTFASTFIVMGAAGRLTQFVLHKKKKNKS